MGDDPFKYFRVEARELLDELVKGVLDLEKGAPVAPTATALLRYAHTLKGAARVVKQPEIADHAHAIEEVLDPFRDATDRVPPDRLEAVLVLLDSISARVGELPSSQAAPAPPASRWSPDEPARTVRADVAELDALLEGVGEARTQLGSLQRGIGGIERARGLADLVVSQLTTSRVQDGSRAEDTRSRVAELRSTIATFEQVLVDGVAQVEQELHQIREAVEKLRLVSAQSMFTDLERAARDVAQTQAKRVVFTGRGGEVRLDAHILVAAQTALQQIVRNAVAHGIETPSERQSARKPDDGRVSIEVSRNGRQAIFTCRDDGRGIDLDAVREAGRRKGLLPAETDGLGPEQLVQLLLRGGISTSGTVTELSGRGIGLDLARDSAARLGGQITVTSVPGAGTTVVLAVPLAVASFEALGVEAGGTGAFIPLEAVTMTARVSSDEIHASAHGEAITVEDKVVPFVALRTILGRAAPDRAPRTWSIAIVTGRNGEAAIGVERIRGASTIVARTLPDSVPPSPLVSGVWLDAEGTPRLVLDPDGLVGEAQRERHRAPGRDTDPLPPVLVVDDSLTTRMLEQSILESAGYDVEVASSGEEALVKARTKPYLLFLVDVEMPGMDGFTFIEQTRADPALREVPAILVTSRAAPEDRQRGLDAGAKDFITKGDFDQVRLLDSIRTLVS